MLHFVRAGEKMTRIFDIARKQPCIILMDEAEELFHDSENECQGARDAKAVFKSHIDGACPEGSGNILLILTANRPWEFPLEIRSRVREWIFFSLPNRRDAFDFLLSYRGETNNLRSDLTDNELLTHFGSGEKSLKYFRYNK